MTLFADTTKSLLRFVLYYCRRYILSIENKSIIKEADQSFQIRKLGKQTVSILAHEEHPIINAKKKILLKKSVNIHIKQLCSLGCSTNITTRLSASLPFLLQCYNIQNWIKISSIVY